MKRRLLISYDDLRKKIIDKSFYMTPYKSIKEIKKEVRWFRMCSKNPNLKPYKISIYKIVKDKTIVVK